MLIAPIKRLLTRWSNQNDAALWQMTTRKMIGQQLAGYGKSERIEAKFFLLAVAPILPLMVSDELDWHRGLLWHAWMCLSIVWAISIFGVMFASLLRAFRRALRDWRNGS